MKKFLGILLSLSMAISCLTAVSAEEEVLLSQGKPVTGGTNGAVQTTVISTPDKIVDGIASDWDQTKMWYIDNDDAYKNEIVWLNMDLEDSYVITKIKWTARYSNTAVWDSKNVNIYGANKADYSDMELILNTGTTEYISEFAIEGAKEYRYLRFEKADTLGGNEIQVYGYKDPASNANLSALAVDGYELDKAFSETDTEYSILITEMPESGTVNVTATAAVDSATVTNQGTITLNQGINEIPVTVTSPNGLVTKTYTLNIVVTESVNVSLGCSATRTEGTATIDANASKLFDGKGNVKANGGGSYKIGHGNAGYIQVDLGAQKNLCEFTWERANQGANKAVVVLGSNDSTFAEGSYVELGRTDGTSTLLGTYSGYNHYLMSCKLDSTNAYQYVRIQKAANAWDFYPVKMDLYGLSAITSVTQFPQIETNVSLNCEATASGALAKNGEANPTGLFTEAGGSGQTCYIPWTATGYIDVDLGTAHKLSRFEWANTVYGSVNVLNVLGSNDGETYVNIGSTVAGEYSCELDSSNAYQYVRIQKPSSNWDFYPTKISVYSMIDDPEATSDITTITVPSRYYAAGDTMIVAVYNNGVLVDMKTVTVQSTDETKDINIPTSDGDSVKLMVWKNLSGVTPRVEAINIAR